MVTKGVDGLTEHWDVQFELVSDFVVPHEYYKMSDSHDQEEEGEDCRDGDIRNDRGYAAQALSCRRIWRALTRLFSIIVSLTEDPSR